MDIKLDFVPPWLINFISRQLIGNGHKLYQKAVGSVATSDQDYRRALEGPMFAQIREALDSHNEPKLDLIDSAKEKPTIPREEHKDDNTPPSIKATTFSEIVEEETESNQCLKGKHIMNGSSGNQIITGQENVLKERVFISPEVERALRTLDQAIAIVRGDRSSVDHSVTKASPISDRGDDRNSSSRDNKPANAAHHSSSVGHFSNGDSALREAKHEQRDTPTRLSVSHEKPSAAAVGMVQPPAVESMRKVCVEERLMANGFNSGDPYGGKPRDKQKVKRHTVCCFSNGLRGGED